MAQAALVLSNQQNAAQFFSGTLKPTMSISAASTLTPAQSGTLFSITPSGAGYAITLPAPTAAGGMCFRFVQAANAAGATSIISTAANVRFHGIANAAQIASAGCTVIQIVGNSAASVGDWIEMYSDGVNWFATGISAVANGFAFA